MRTFQQLKRLLKQPDPDYPRVRLALLGDSATQFLATAIQGEALARGICLELFEGEYNQVERQVLDPTSDLHRFGADFLVVFQSSHKLLEKYSLMEADRRSALADDELCCFTGQSGAGKSTMLNALLDLNLETGNISEKISRGKNTTRHTELIEKNGIRVMDTAGFNLLEAENDLEPEKLRERYPEFAPYEGKYRFRECLHDREPGCAVDEAARKGMISAGRLERYRELLAETREIWRERYD